MTTHECGGTILVGGAGEQAHQYCDCCRAFTHDLNAPVPGGTDVALNREAWDAGEDESPDAETTTDTITDEQIKALRQSAGECGDDAMICIATVALDGWSDLQDPACSEASRFEDRFGGAGHRISARDQSRISRMSQEQARAECARVIADAEAQS